MFVLVLGDTRLKINPAAPLRLEDGRSFPPGHFTDPEARAQYGVVEEPDPVWPDPLLFNAIELPSGQLQVNPKSPEEAAQALNAMREQMKHDLAGMRYHKEVAGITLEDGFFIMTDRDSQFKILGVQGALEKGLFTETQFKGQNGWRTIGPELAAIVVVRVTTYVQACYANERRLSDMIDAADAEGLRALDLTDGWPT